MRAQRRPQAMRQWVSWLVLIALAHSQVSWALQIELKTRLRLRQAQSLGSRGELGQIDMDNPIGWLAAGTVLEIPDEYLVYGSDEAGKSFVDLSASIQNWAWQGRDGAGLYRMRPGHRDFYLPAYTSEEMRAAKREGRAPKAKGLVALDYLTRAPGRMVVASRAPLYSKLSSARPRPFAQALAPTRLQKKRVVQQRVQQRPEPRKSGVELVSLQVPAQVSALRGATMLVSSPLPQSQGVKVNTCHGDDVWVRGKLFRNHAGIDMTTPSQGAGSIRGDVVATPISGRVVKAAYESGYGYYVKIASGATEVTLGHLLGPANVREGQSLSAGHIVGRVGASGQRQTGYHLLLETRVNGRVVDPLSIMPVARLFDTSQCRQEPPPGTEIREARSRQSDRGAS